MKKYLVFAAAASLFAACSSDDLATSSPTVAQQTADDGAVRFDVYADRSVTRDGTPGSISTTALQTGTHKDAGFGVFAYYTDNTDYTQYATPNFMYNQQVKYSGGVWTYTPVKYWPNEFGSGANSDDVDKVTFFAYAPWVNVTPTSGSPSINKETNITQITKNTATGDPIIKYVVDTDPTTSVDLLWGVVPAGDTYQAVNGTTAAPSLTPGLPYLDLVKAQAANRVKFNFKHALAKLNIQIDAFVDEIANTTPLDVKTRIYVRSITLGGFAMKGALNLNNTTANTPLWIEYDGSKELAASTVTFYDGRKDGKEATANGEQKSEKPANLNDAIVEDEKTYENGAFGAQAKQGVTNVPVNLFHTTGSADDYIYVIPTNEQMDVTIVYDVETIDPNLSGYLADGATHGSSIENRIYKESVFGGNIEAGKAYQLKLHLGMTSVKVDAEVVDWDATTTKDVDLPNNTRSVYVTPSVGNVVASGASVALTAKLGDGTAVTLSDNNYTGDVKVNGTTNTFSGTLTTSSIAIPANTKVYKTYYSFKVTGIEHDAVSYESNNITITQDPTNLGFTAPTISNGATEINLASSTTGTVDDWTTSDVTVTILVNDVPLVKGTDFTVSTDGKVTLNTAAVTSQVFKITIKAGDALAETQSATVGA